MSSQNSCSSLHDAPGKYDESDNNVLDNDCHDIDKCTKQNDSFHGAEHQVIDLTQEKESSSPSKSLISDERDFSSPDIFADSDPEIETSVASRQKSLVKSGKSDYSLPSP